MKHIVIYQEEGRYAAWPANYGIWGFGNEIVVGFTSGYYLNDGGFHSRDRTKPFTAMQARSLDGGEHWECVEMPVKTPGNLGLSVGEHTKPDSHNLEINRPIPLDVTTDFQSDNFAMMFGRKDLEGDAASWLYVSQDRCHSWQGPFELSKMNQIGIAARTDYLVESSSTALIFLTAQTISGQEIGSRVFVARTENGGKTHQFLSWIDKPDENVFSIMPASVRISDNKILVANRIRKYEVKNQTSNYIDLYCSEDNGESWSYVTRPVSNTGIGGNPPTLTLLEDGRLVMTYGFRDQKWGMRAKISCDQGETWGDEIILRDDAGNHDVGYPRAVLRPDGTLVIVYYYNDEQFRSCYIAATLWKP